MVKTSAVVAIALFVGLAPAFGDTVRHEPDRAKPPVVAPAQAPVLDPLDIPRWMGDAVGHILSGDDPQATRQPSGQ